MHEPDTPSRHVFVYGTLRRGEANDITRLHPVPCFVGLAHVPGTLYHLGGYPGLRLQGDTPVLGEVYAIEPALETVLDEIEAVYPQQSDEYRKREVRVWVASRWLVCLVYEIQPVHVLGRPVIDSGDWVLGRGA